MGIFLLYCPMWEGRVKKKTKTEIESVRRKEKDVEEKVETVPKLVLL